jgi:hypothetical protein
MRAVFGYAEWARSIAANGKPSNFDEMPEVREVLEAHLDVSREPTRTIRSIYGENLSRLLWLDRNWLFANLDRILPVDEEQYSFFRAAWTGFVVCDTARPTLLKPLTSSYRKAIQHLGKDTQIKPALRPPEECLAEHLMVYYWLGELRFGGTDKLLDDFYTSASGEIRGHAMRFVGNSVARWDNDVPAEAFGRLQELFRIRLEDARGGEGAVRLQSELVNFGYWFISRRFDERWAIETLITTVRLSKKSEPAMQVLETLADVSLRYPAECVLALGSMIEGDTEGWLLVGNEASMRLILSRSLNSANPEASISARRLTEELIARGHFQFRDLVA